MARPGAGLFRVSLVPRRSAISPFNRPRRGYLSHPQPRPAEARRMDQLSLDIVVTRGAIVESQHRVHAAVVDATGKLIGAARDSNMMTHWRSCAKPFQVMPLLESGGFDKIGWGDDQLALACASHGGEPEHVAVAEAMLASIGMEQGDLACGPHDPLAQRGQKFLRETGSRPTRLHNNCSGKHAAMLAHAHTNGWPAFGYERQEHQVQ